MAVRSDLLDRRSVPDAKMRGELVGLGKTSVCLLVGWHGWVKLPVASHIKGLSCLVDRSTRHSEGVQLYTTPLLVAIYDALSGVSLEDGPRNMGN